MKKKQKLDIRNIQKRFDWLWRDQLFKYEKDYMWTRYRDKLDKEYQKKRKELDIAERGIWWRVKCISCENIVNIDTAQACHWIPREHYRCRREKRNVKAGCVRCNCYNKQEHMLWYTEYQIKEMWADWVREKLAEKNKIHKDPNIHELIALHDVL